jgi:hypothetical protein
MPIGGRCFWWWNYRIQEKKIFFNFLKVFLKRKNKEDYKNTYISDN